MRSPASFVSAVHRRADVLRRKAAKKQIAFLSVFNAGLLTALCARIGAPHSLSTVPMAGSSLLDDSAGGYVAVAISSFMLGAAVTFFLRKHLQKKAARKPDPADKRDPD